MNRIYPVKNVPSVVANYFECRFSWPEKYTFKYYWYYDKKGEEARKIYGCEVYKDGEYWHNATQADLKTYQEMTSALA